MDFTTKLQQNYVNNNSLMSVWTDSLKWQNSEEQ